MTKIFYYDDESENLLEEDDAEEAELEEILDEVFELADDDISYIGAIAHNKKKYKIKSDAYDSYKVYRFDNEKKEYILVELGDWEKCQLYLRIVL